MKVKVLKEFRDKANFAIIYKVDDVVEMQKDRFLELKAKGLVEEIRKRDNKHQK